MSDKYSKNNNEFKLLSNQLTENLNKSSIDSIINKLNILKKKYPADIRVYNLLSLFFNKNNNYHEAINVCKESIYLFPKNSDTYCIMAESFLMLNMVEEAIDNYKKSISYNSNHYLSYYSLGCIMWTKLKIDEAIYNYKKVLDINPNFIEAQKLNQIIITNQKLKKIKCRFDLNNKITDNSVVKLCQKIQQIIKVEKLNIELEASQIHRKSIIKYNCNRHFEVFNTFNIIPENCFGCYKIQIEPKNVLELLKLYIVFDNLNLKKNLSRKCMLEYRLNVKGVYKGYVYCIGLEEAENTLKLFNPILDVTINTQISRLIKRGCSEFGLAYPEYTELNPDNPRFMNYKENWRAKEKIIDRKLKTKNPLIRKRDESHLGITLKDALIINNWLFYAKKIGDDSVNKICKEVPYSHYMDKLLSEKIVNNLKPKRW